LLKLEDLKNWLHRDLSQGDKCLLVLGSFNAPSQVQDIKARAKDAGFKTLSKWNVSLILSRTKGRAINTPVGWELSEAGKQHLKTLGVAKVSPAAAKVATDLRELLKKVKDNDTRAFVEEAVQCHELDFFRSAIVMSWLAAIHILKVEVLTNHLAAFNAEAQRVNVKWKTAKTLDDIGLMREDEFLDRIAVISVIGKNVKEDLQQALKRRNGCGHPSSLKVGPNTVAHHIETLLQNVFHRFC